MLLRLILPGGRLTSSQLKAIAEIASELDLEFAALTPCRTLDLYGISAAQAADPLHRLAESGISAQEIPAGCPGMEVSAAPEPDCVGVREQEQADLFTIGVPVLAGRLSVHQMRKAADLAERHADGRLQTTSRQNLLLLNIPKERVLQALEGLEAVDLRVAASVYRRGLTACMEVAQERARDLLDYLERQVPLKEPVRIHFSAGACNCEQALEAEIGLRAVRVQVEERMIEAVDVAVAGQPVPSARGVPAGLAKVRLENLLVAYKRSRQPAESLREFCRRSGEQGLARFLSDEREESRSR